MRGGRARRQPDRFTKEHYFRVEVFRATLDTQLHELEFRFNDKVLDLLTTSATLIPKNKFRSFKADDICELVKKYYPADFTQQEIYGLEQQLKHFVVDASNDKELKNVSTLTNLCRYLFESGRHSIYNLVDRLLRLLLTLPVSTASAERAVRVRNGPNGLGWRYSPLILGLIRDKGRLLRGQVSLAWESSKPLYIKRGDVSI
uniref:Uncharacterized protein n=1 Tax=Triticum urartu TaxID=4572 RepID=A0A8R7RCS6_TRIUA